MIEEISIKRGIAKHGDISLAYEVFGPATGKPLLLIMGVGMQMLLWHDDFCRELVRQGFQVARMDNRDVGLSTHLSKYGEPKLFDMIFRPKATAVYSLTDMAGDAVAVLDALGWKSANIVGGSMGGFIAQVLATKWPERVCSLTSIMASPSPRIGRSTIRLGMKVGGVFRQPLHNTQEAGQQIIDVYKIIGTPAENYPLDEAWLREVGAKSYERAYDPAGKLRQQAALLASGNRTKDLGRIHVPTLVMHGSVDPLFRLKGGEATAAAIPGAKLVVLKGVGHGAFPREVWPTMIQNITTIGQ